jgi:hypothetical protein
MNENLKNVLFHFNIVLCYADYDIVKVGRANGRDPKTCLDRVFNCKLGCFDDVHIFVYVDAYPYL